MLRMKLNKLVCVCGWVSIQAVGMTFSFVTLLLLGFLPLASGVTHIRRPSPQRMSAQPSRVTVRPCALRPHSDFAANFLCSSVPRIYTEYMRTSPLGRLISSEGSESLKSLNRPPPLLFRILIRISLRSTPGCFVIASKTLFDRL